MTEFVKCSFCGKDMPIERLECYKTCIECTDQSEYFGVTDVFHKTGNQTVLIKGNDTESVRRAQRVNRRSR